MNAPNGEALIQSLCERVAAHAESATPLQIRGSGSKAFLARTVDATPLEVGGLTGVVSYEPTELVVSAYAGTPLAALECTLAEAGQHLPFEPPRFGAGGTLGGAVASGLSGPARPFRGPLRDYVLGVSVIDGRARQLNFGGEVMKNVAGYDLSRLMTGAWGTLGVLLKVSLKVLPRAPAELSLRIEMSSTEALQRMLALANQALPLSALAYLGGAMHVRLSGAASSVQAAAAQIGGERMTSDDFWSRLRDHELDFFTSDLPLWRVAVPPATPALALDAETCLDWGGTQRWLKTRADADAVRAEAARHGGHAMLFGGSAGGSTPMQPLPDTLLPLHQRLKQAFDPSGILNPGRMYSAF